MNNVAILILSDPKNGGEEALGRVFNGFAAAYDIRQAGGDVLIYFQGTATRWISHLTKEDHPLNALYHLVKDDIAGVSSGCADFFGGGEDATCHGLKIIAENLIPGTTGLPSVSKLLQSNRTVLTF